MRYKPKSVVRRKKVWAIVNKKGKIQGDLGSERPLVFLYTKKEKSHADNVCRIMTDLRGQQFDVVSVTIVTKSP